MKTRRTAIVRLSPQDLETLLVMPPGLRVVSTRDHWAMAGIDVLIEGDSLEEVDERVEPPTLWGQWERNSATGRLHWHTPVQEETR